MNEYKNPTELFNFLVVRNQPRRQRERHIIQTGSLGEESSPLRKQLDVMENKTEEQSKLAANYLGENIDRYTTVRAHLIAVFEPLWRADKVDLQKVRNAINQVAEGADQSPTAIGHLLEDMILAWSLRPPQRADELDQVIRFLKFWYLGVTEAGQSLLPAVLEAALNRIVVVLPKTLRGALVGEKPVRGKGIDIGGEGKQQKEEDIEKELIRLQKEVGILNETLAGVEEEIRSGRAMRNREEREEHAPQEEEKQPSFISRILQRQRKSVKVAVSSASMHREFDISFLPSQTKKALVQFVGPIEGISEPELLDRLGAQIRAREARIFQVRKEAHKWLVIGNMLVKTSRKQKVPWEDASEPTKGTKDKNDGNDKEPGSARHSPMVYYAGVADLKIVKEKLVGYELGDIAHIENVLSGEEKERRHRRMESTETEEVIITEKEEETERDSQSTTKNELATESSMVAKDTVKVDGSLTVSGSYGPTVDFSASASAGYTSETTTSEKRAASFAQEVVQKTVEKVRSRVMEQRRVRTLTEIEETNLHAIRNAYPGARHVRGVYRWLNKISQAQVYNYGMRHMFSFVVPEPSTFYLWSLERNSAVIQEPVRPYFDASYLDRHNFQLKAAEYEASGVLAPPDRYMTVSESKNSSESAASGSYTSLSGKIPIPPGYIATSAHVRTNFINETYFQLFDPFMYWHLGHIKRGYDFTGLIGKYANEISYGLITGNVGAGYFFSIDLICYLDSNSKLFREWQTKTFEAIMEGYKRQVSDYEEKLANAATQQGIPIPGRNSLENEQIIRAELKRACLSMYLGIDLDHINAFRSSDPVSPDYWKINYSVAPTLGFQIAFMERAFEWENLTYMFYPYFYGRFNEWSRRVIELGVPDPNMAAFLRAGAARVLVPARPEFAEALLHFGQRGDIPPGAESLLTAGDAIEAMIDEVRAQGTDSIPNAKPEGDPWEVKLPTSLVLLQDPQEITFRDALYGDQNGEAKVDFDLQSMSANEDDTTSGTDS